MPAPNMEAKLKDMDAKYAALRALYVKAGESMDTGADEATDTAALMAAGTDFAITLMVPVVATLLTAGQKSGAVHYVQEVASDIMQQGIALAAHAMSAEVIEGAMRAASGGTTAGIV